MCHSDSLEMLKIYHDEVEDGDFATTGSDLGVSCRECTARIPTDQSYRQG